MRILHAADIHLGELNGPVIDGKNARMMDTVACMNFLAEKAAMEQPDAILISGDLFHKSKLWGDEMLREVGLAARWLRSLAAIAPTVLLFGTRNHDSMEAYMNIKSMDITDLYVVTEPKLFPLFTKSGTLQVAGIPGFDKAYFRSQNPGMIAEDENQLCSQLLGSLVLGMSAELNQAEPAVLMAHYAVAGADYDNGESIFANSEVVLPLDALAASSFDLICLGHIHRAQSIPNCGRPAYYSGALNGITFNEEGQDKGFWMHKLDGAVNSEFIKTPYRKFITEHWDELFIQRFIEGHKPGPGFSNSIVRLHYSCSDELNKRLNRKELEKALYEVGAFHVAEVRPAQVYDSLDKTAMAENTDPLSALSAWLLSEGISAEETAAIVELANPLVATVSAKLPTGKISGVFEPLSLEVKNYRSYREESFDFTKVSFATVNGPNGVGKSALFMDAVKDCLYEETRENDIEAWISRPDAKSGSIIFTFRMGDSVWRVTRTRTRSGKSTLALDEKKEGDWVPHSADDKRETQKRIVAMLGMDAATFQSCALIMQDAYGLFLEAGKEDRMQVIANILGLGIYDELTDLAKAKVTEVNRALEKAKAQIADIDTRLAVKPSLAQQLNEAKSEIETVQTDIASKEIELQAVQVEHAALVAKLQQADGLALQAIELRNAIITKTAERDRQQGRLKVANALLDQEANILSKAAEYEETKTALAALSVKRNQQLTAYSEASRLKNELDSVEISLTDVGTKIIALESTLSKRDSMETDAKEYNSLLSQLQIQTKFRIEHEQRDQKLQQAKVALMNATTKSEHQIKAQETELVNLQSRVAMLADANCVDIDKASCRFLADAKAAQIRLADAEKELIARKSESTREFQQLGDLVTDAQNSINSLGYNSDEHTRLLTRSEELRPQAEAFAKLDSAAELLTTFKGQETELKTRQTDLAIRLEAQREQHRQLSQDLKLVPELESRISSLAPWLKSKDDLPASREIATTANERITALNSEIDADTLKATTLEQEATLIKGNSDLLKLVMDKKLTDAQDAIKVHRDRHTYLVGHSGGITAKLEALAQDETDKADLIEQSKSVSVELVRYQKLAAAFGDDGIPFRIVRSVVPELSMLANDILGQMTGGKMTLEMKTERVQKSSKKEVNALEIWITDYIRGAMPYKSRSGGQKVKAALSVAFALADLKARRAGIQLGMMFVDEPPFLDADGIDAYCDALELLSQRYPNMRVIAISHDPRMKARFPQEINVEDTGEGGSKVRIA